MSPDLLSAEIDLALAGRILEPKCLLDGIRVEPVQGTFTRPVEPFRAGVDPAIALGNLLDADGDLHAAGLY